MKSVNGVVAFLAGLGCLTYAGEVLATPAHASVTSEASVPDGEEDEEEKLEAEDDATLQAKNLENEIAYRDHLQAQQQRDERAAKSELKKERGTPGCTILKTGPLDVATNPTDVLTIVPMSVSIEARHLTISYQNNAGPPVLRIPLIEIATPVETLARTRRCFRLFHGAKPVVFCASDTSSRDDWVTNIYKAVFCINSGTPLAPKKATKVTSSTSADESEKFELPAKSTKVERWMKEEAKREAAAAKEAQDQAAPHRKKVAGSDEIEITTSGAQQPYKVTINGEDLPTQFPGEGGGRMNEGNQEA